LHETKSNCEGKKKNTKKERAYTLTNHLGSGLHDFIFGVRVKGTLVSVRRFISLAVGELQTGITVL
jgi:hypothetical protein